VKAPGVVAVQQTARDASLGPAFRMPLRMLYPVVMSERI